MPYAPVNDLDMYYEIHGEGRPTLLLPGAYMTTESMEPLLAPLAKTRRVIAVDPQGHGRTADIDRPITYEGMADDMAGLARRSRTRTSCVAPHLRRPRSATTGCIPR